MPVLPVKEDDLPDSPTCSGHASDDCSPEMEALKAQLALHESEQAAHEAAMKANMARVQMAQVRARTESSKSMYLERRFAKNLLVTSVFV